MYNPRMISSIVWVLLGAGAYGAAHSVLASHTVKGWAEQKFGDTARRVYRLGFILTAILTSPLLLLPVLLPDRPFYAIPMPWLLLTLALQGLALIGLAMTVGQTGSGSFLGLRQMTQPAPLRSRSGPEQLVTTGFYRYVRHPIYTCSFVLIWLMPVVSWNMLALMAGLTVYTFIGTLLEERKLREEFGAAYEEYRRRTPMVIPHMRIGKVEQ
jgi:protein-S-isoprenylcysteine O-methyltransferase Ste14